MAPLIIAFTAGGATATQTFYEQRTHRSDFICADADAVYGAYIRMRQTESLHLATQHVSALESDKKFQMSDVFTDVFSQLSKMVERYLCEQVVVFRIFHRGLNHAVAELLPTVARTILTPLLVMS